MVVDPYFWPPIVQDGKIYPFCGNVPRGSKAHQKYLRMLDRDKPVLIRENAVDGYGQPLADYVAIYVWSKEKLRDTRDLARSHSQVKPTSN